MKIGVYSIAKDERQFVERWAESATGADVLFVLDTGSTDGTQEALRAAGAVVVEAAVDPWRFDDARNASLALLPSDLDYCIALDLDEVLVGDWRGALEKALADGVTRPRYRYTWSWRADGAPGLVYGGEKIHARRGYRWRHPVHERLVPVGIQEAQGWYDFEIHHHPDSTKSRGQYLGLLQLAVAEDPADDRSAHYYARELMYVGRLEEAAREFRRHLSLPSARWGAERAASYRYLARCEPVNRVTWLRMAALEAPETREPWVELATAYEDLARWPECYAAATAALAIRERPLTYLNEDAAWGARPHDLAALASYFQGRFGAAVTHGQAALAESPGDVRLQENLTHYLRAETGARATAS